MDNLTTEVEKRYWEVYENCYGNESELEVDDESNIDIEWLIGKMREKVDQNSPSKVYVDDLNVMCCITMYMVFCPFYRYMCYMFYCEYFVD